MKENNVVSTALKKNLNMTNEEISINAGTSVLGGDDDSSFQELKTPAGQPSGHYITPTSNMNLV
jgi:hypothetical protein